MVNGRISFDFYNNTLTDINYLVAVSFSGFVRQGHNGNLSKKGMLNLFTVLLFLYKNYHVAYERLGIILLTQY